MTELEHLLRRLLCEMTLLNEPVIKDKLTTLADLVAERLKTELKLAKEMATTAEIC